MKKDENNNNLILELKKKLKDKNTENNIILEGKTNPLEAEISDLKNENKNLKKKLKKEKESLENAPNNSKYVLIIQQYELFLSLLSLQESALFTISKNPDILDKSDIDTLNKKFHEILNYQNNLEDFFQLLKNYFNSNKSMEEILNQYTINIAIENAKKDKRDVIYKKIVDFIKFEELVNDKDPDFYTLNKLAPTFIELYLKRLLHFEKTWYFFTESVIQEKEKIMSGKEELPKSITFKIDVEAIAKKSNLEIVGELSVSTKSLKENIDNGVEKLKSTEQTKIILKNIESELGRSDSYPINQELKKTAQKNGKLTIDDFKKTFKDYNEKQIIFILMVLVQNDFGGTPYILLSQLLALTSVQFDLDPVRFGHERDISFEQNADKVTFTIMNALFGLNENNAIGKATASYTVDVKNFSITCHPGYIELYPLIITEYCKTDWREVNKKFIEIGRTLISNENKIGDNNKFKLN